MSTARIDRFMAKVTAVGECWEWTASTSTNGYGSFWNGSRLQPAHRWSYEYFVAEIPDGLVLDHLCRNIRCVNPWHAEPVPQRVNVERAVRLVVTACKHGHEFTEGNTYVARDGKRACRACHARRQRVRGRDVRDSDPLRVGVA